MFSPQINKKLVIVNSTSNTTYTFLKSAVVVAQLRSKNLIDGGVCFKHQLTANTLFNTSTLGSTVDNSTGYARLFPDMASGCCYVTQGQTFEFYKYGSTLNYLELNLFLFEVE